MVIFLNYFCGTSVSVTLLSQGIQISWNYCAACLDLEIYGWLEIYGILEDLAALIACALLMTMILRINSHSLRVNGYWSRAHQLMGWTVVKERLHRYNTM